MADIKGQGSDMEGPYPSSSINRFVKALERFPDWTDSSYALMQGFAHARPDAEYLEGKKYTTSPGGNIGDAVEVYQKGSGTKARLKSTDIIGPRAEMLNASNPGLADLYMQNALAVKRSALAQLGWDPANTVLNLTPSHMVSGNGRNEIAGFHVPGTMQNWINGARYDKDPSVMTHEAIHRGVSKLQQTGYWDPAWDPMGSPLPKGFSERNPEGNQGVDNEAVVRWLMMKKMGDPEGAGGITDTQKNNARAVFNSKDRFKQLAAMEDAAARYLAAGKPNPNYVPSVVRGPR